MKRLVYNYIYLHMRTSIHKQYRGISHSWLHVWGLKYKSVHLMALEKKFSCQIKDLYLRDKASGNSIHRRRTNYRDGLIVRHEHSLSRAYSVRVSTTSLGKASRYLIYGNTFCIS